VEKGSGSKKPIPNGRPREIVRTVLEALSIPPRIKRISIRMTEEYGGKTEKRGFRKESGTNMSY